MIARERGSGETEVNLRLPPPLDEWLRLDDEGRVWDDHALVAEVRAGAVELEPPAPVSWDDAVAAQAPDLDSPFPHCFVCGHARTDGLHIHAGPVAGRDVVAAPWQVAPDAVGPEFVWAALDCPGAYATGVLGRGTIVVGRLTARVERVPQAGGAASSSAGRWVARDASTAPARSFSPMQASYSGWRAPSGSSRAG